MILIMYINIIDVRGCQSFFCISVIGGSGGCGLTGNYLKMEMSSRSLELKMVACERPVFFVADARCVLATTCVAP